MMQKIVYLIDSLHKPHDSVLPLLCQKINWLAENSAYEIHVVSVEKSKKTPCCQFSSKVNVTNLAINYDELHKFPFFKRIVMRAKKRVAHQKLLEKALTEIQPTTIVSIYGMKNRWGKNLGNVGKNILEIHADRKLLENILIEKSRSYISMFSKMYFKFRFWKELKEYDTVVYDTEELRQRCEDKTSHYTTLTISNPMMDYPEFREKESQKVMAIGDFYTKSSFEQLISIWERITFKYPEWRLHLYGNGEQLMCKNIIKEKHLSKTVQCYPLPINMHEVYPKYSLYIQTNEMDEYGHRVMEAMANGIPCIAYDVPFGLRELIQNEANGFLVIPNHQMDFTCKLGILIRNQVLRDSMSRQAYEDMRKYELVAIMKRWMDIYE